ncbi:MAG: DMT family transporter [Cyanobacteria bacterium P01_F01_bin.86]
MPSGEIAALGAAFLWALATVVYGHFGKSLSPLILNLVKGIIAIAFITLTLALQTNLQPELPGTAVVWLLLSGAIGIGLGDTAYFTALNALGARQTLLMESLAPPLTALLALLFLQEQLSIIAWMGVFLTPLGVTWVISERVPAPNGIQIQPWRGVMWALLAELAQATGAVISRGALADTVVDPLWSGLLRIVAGVVVLIGLVLAPGWGQRQVGAQLQQLRSHRLLPWIALAAFLGTYLAIWLQQVSLKYAPAGIAQALLATSPLFVLPVAAMMGDRVSWRATLGVLVAIGGVWLLISSS